VRKAAICASVAAACWQFAYCAAGQNINFLTPGSGSWIVYPSPLRVPPYAGTPMTAVFRGHFVLPTTPVGATLSWRCFKAGQLWINGALAAIAAPDDWNKTRALMWPAIFIPGPTKSRHE